MTCSNCFAEVMAKWVKHGMVRMDRRKAVLVKLLSHNADQLLHASLIISPVTNNLQAVSQVAISIREVWLQFQSCAVRLNSFWDVSRVLKEKMFVLSLHW